MLRALLKETFIVQFDNDVLITSLCFTFICFALFTRVLPIKIYTMYILVLVCTALELLFLVDVCIAAEVAVTFKTIVFPILQVYIF